MKLSIILNRGIAFLIDIFIINIISKIINHRFQITNIDFSDPSILNIFHIDFGLKITQYTIVESLVFFCYFIILENYTKIYSVGKYFLKIGIDKDYNIKNVLLRTIFKYFIFITLPLTIIYLIFFNKRTLLHDHLFKTKFYQKSEKALQT
jgi:uncharacterized RDD family membrane protein YckC